MGLRLYLAQKKTIIITYSKTSALSLIQRSLPYCLGSELFTALANKAGNILFASATHTKDGKDLLLFNASELEIAWIDKKKPDYLKYLDGSQKSIAHVLKAIKSKKNTEEHSITGGYLSYNLGNSLHNIQSANPNITGLPDLFIGVYKTWIEIDHIQKTATFFSSNINDTAPVDLPQALQPFSCNNNFEPSISKAEYFSKIQRILEYITAGDCYQVNYAQHFSANYSGHSYDAFNKIIKKMSAPYSTYINTGFGEILSFSPEQFLSVNTKNIISTKPIKGTAPRHANDHKDTISANALQNSAKDKSENLMIVDLLRNDLGKSCTPGSIKANELFKLESFTNVHHLVSTISGKLKTGISATEAMLSCFPGGSITGAPKIRSMQIIDELEPMMRSAYCGTAFYQSKNGHFDSNIMIRTLIAERGKIHCWGGGGIVADSKPEQEYQETLDKIGAFIEILESL